MKKYPVTPLKVIRQYEPEMKRLKVSEVARSPRGFLTNLKRNDGRITPEWEARRNGFISRHMAQYRKHRTPRRRLALIAWAYRPR
jgi:hypothetical protein